MYSQLNESLKNKSYYQKVFKLLKHEVKNSPAIEWFLIRSQWRGGREDSVQRESSAYLSQILRP